MEIFHNPCAYSMILFIYLFFKTRTYNMICEDIYTMKPQN